MQNNDLRELVRSLAHQYLPDVTGWRRHFHRNPELSFEEKETSAYIAGLLREMDIPFTEGIGGYGIVGIIEGTDPASGVYALRADMDALPIQEKNDVPYRSANNGVMHACGHDAHTSSLLGAARILHETREHWTGTVKLIFQPGEEKMPGGASKMIGEGALKSPDASGILGQHVLPQLEAGKLGFRPGMYMASCDEIYITVKGKGGHGATPELNIDPVLIASHLVVALQQVISRRASPKWPTVLSFGKIIGEGATNVIPDEVRLEGTFRALNEEWREQAHQIIHDMSVQLVQSMGGKCEIDIVKGYPYLENHVELTKMVKEAAMDYLGRENVVELDLWLAGEDFSYYTHEIPGCFYRFGVGNRSRGITSAVHTATFDIDESSLSVSSGFMAWAAICCLQNPAFHL